MGKKSGEETKKKAKTAPRTLSRFERVLRVDAATGKQRFVWRERDATN